MRYIPDHLIRTMEADPFYEKCCITGKEKKFVKIDWHHCWEYKGKQINRKWAIMPVWSHMHAFSGSYMSIHNCKSTREKVKYLAMLRATPEELAEFPKIDWEQKRKYFESVYGDKDTILKSFSS